ncbi:ABC transporter substrate-binding protein [Nocardia sp. NEAU-351]|uniref:ABC transporter substrate-binding protein n=1 Tax=Nocardia bovistercoris TaxID=2785916 RepID=A0A931IFD1_9NOCA|nr:ABC transporter substrate-binding protein [Nocardia bovistercoris]MBH0780419.1 ABC transporter substrate-binding protein [Nocardia bovistercoris]
MLIALALVLLAGCARQGSGPEEGSHGEPGSSVPAAFGDLGPVCGKGAPTESSARGVTADAITVGVFTDLGFTKNTEYVDASEVFAKWCNEHGGIAGREIRLNIRDTRLTEVRQRMRESCRDDFAIVGGMAGLDSLGVKDRLSCLLPSFPAQIAQPGSIAADLEVSAAPTALPRHDLETGFRQWLVEEGYPESKSAIGMVDGDSPITKVFADKAQESLESLGATVVYRDRYPIAGVADWTPYAYAIKDKQVRGLIFNGEPAQLPKLEEALTAIGYRPDWIDAKNNNYTESFLKAAGRSIEFQNNVIDLYGVAPFEKADSVPALRQFQDMFARYAPDAEMSLPQVRSISAWLLFARSAAECGDHLTRRCLYEHAVAETAWTGGGLQAPVDLSDREEPVHCFNVERATPAGWVPVDLGTGTSLYRCGVRHYRFQKDYGAPMTLADVGKSMTDLN